MSRFNGLAYAGHDGVALTHDMYGDVWEAELRAEFVAWLRSEDGHGWWAASEIDTLLKHYCEERGLTPPAKAKARNLMLHVPGVYRERHRLTGPVFARIARATGQERATVYWIPPSEPVAGPWPVSDRSTTGQRLVNDRSTTGQRQVCEGSIR